MCVCTNSTVSSVLTPFEDKTTRQLCCYSYVSGDTQQKKHLLPPLIMSDPLEDEIRRQKYLEMLMTPSVRKTEQEEEVAESPLPTEAKYINKVST